MLARHTAFVTALSAVTPLAADVRTSSSASVWVSRFAFALRSFYDDVSRLLGGPQQVTLSGVFPRPCIELLLTIHIYIILGEQC